MKAVIYSDRRGWKRRVFIKDGDDESQARYGIPAGPPDLEQIDWDEFKRVLNNWLVDSGLFDWQAVQRSDMMPAAANIFKRYLIDLYRRSSKTQPSE